MSKKPLGQTESVVPSMGSCSAAVTGELPYWGRGGIDRTLSKRVFILIV